MTATGPAPAAAPGEPRRRPGRPRDEAAAGAILAATMELLAEVGFAGVTVDAVAARAGVGKATIYRRWPSKERLVLAAIAGAKEPVPVPDTGTVEGDLRELYGTLAEQVSDPNARGLLTAVVAQAAVDPDVQVELAELVNRRKEASRVVLRRAVDRGQLPAGIDLDLVVDMLSGTIMYRSIFGGQRVSQPAVARLVTAVLRSVGP